MGRLISSPPAELQGLQQPRIDIHPLYLTSAAEDAIDLAAVAGLILDPWQEYSLELTLSERRGGKWAAFEVAWLVPRQNGKGGGVEAYELFHMLLCGTKIVTHTAHDFNTASDAFQKLKARIMGCPEILEMIYGYEGQEDERQIPGFRTAHGFEGIEFKNRGLIRYKTRTKNLGRGTTSEILIVDEAFAYTTEQQAAIMPVMSSFSMQGNPQILYLSSAPKPDEPFLHSLRARALGDDPGSLVYLEHSAAAEAEDFDPSDPQAWAEANPALGIRISEDYIAAEFRSMELEKFLRERLGIFPPQLGEEASPILAEDWAALADHDSQIGEVLAFGVDVPPSRDSAVISVASIREDGLKHIEVIAQEIGTGWVAQQLGRLQQEFPTARVVIDAGSAANTLLPELKRQRVRVSLVNFRTYAASCGVFLETYQSKSLRHIDQPQLTGAVDNARMKPVGDSLWKWVRKEKTADISPLVAATLALHGLSLIRPTSGRRRRKVTVG